MSTYVDIVNSVPISSVLASYSLYPKVKRHYRLPCPIHGSNNPTSFIVTDDKLFYCHACHAGGTSIDLYSAMERVSKQQAVEQLSQQFHVTSVGDFRRVANQTQSNFELLKQVENPFYVGHLPDMEVTDNYRGLSRATFLHFDVATDAEASIYFPIKEVRGSLVGCAIRRATKLPKYLYPKGFRKSSVLYGLHENLQYIQQTKEIVLVEGPFDVLATYDAGIANVAAVLGSSLSKLQAKLLLLSGVELVRVLFDGDAAGRSGASKLSKVWANVFDIDVIKLPEGTDPSDAKEELRELL